MEYSGDNIMRKLILFMLLSGYAIAQNTPTIGVLPDNGPNLPTTCVIGQIYFRTSTTIGLNQCNPANTWTALSTSTGGASSGTVGQVQSTDGAGGFTNSAAQGTLTVSTPFLNHSSTWNAGAVAFTDWISNITCTAAATASIAGGLGTAGTQWQFKYAAANCGSPQFLVPSGTAASPSVSFSAFTNYGMYANGSVGTAFSAAGNDSFAPGTAARMASGVALSWNSTGSFSTGALDTGLSRISAGVTGVGTGAQGSVAGTIQSGAYQTGTNCAAVGTAANPSVASCAAAAAGSFSCATNASTGTCTVNTTAVTANSEIFIEGRNDTVTGTRLSVTCNTGITTALPEISAVVAATSFTINLGTFTTNPECFSYFIVN
jgi:hypothetical protein